MMALLLLSFVRAHFVIALGHSGLAGQANTAFFINTEALDPNFIAQLYDVLGLLNSEISQFADMLQAVFARQEFDKCAEVFYRDHLSTVDLAHLRFRSHPNNR